MVPILVELLWVEVRGEGCSPIGGGAGDVVEGRGVVVVVVVVRLVVGRVDVIDRWGPAVGRPRGGRDHTQGAVETWGGTFIVIIDWWKAWVYFKKKSLSCLDSEGSKSKEFPLKHPKIGKMSPKIPL